MFDFRNVNDLMRIWEQKKQYETRSERGLKGGVSKYISFLEREDIIQIEPVMNFWVLFEVYLSMSLSVEGYGLRGAYKISKRIIEELQFQKQTSPTISLFIGDIRYAYIDRNINGIEISLFKSIPASTIARKRSLEVINIGEIFRELFNQEFFDLFKLLSEYKKPNESFEFIHITELDSSIVNKLTELLKEHAEKYNLGEVYTEEMLVNLEQFMNNLGNSSFNSYAK